MTTLTISLLSFGLSFLITRLVLDNRNLRRELHRKNNTIHTYSPQNANNLMSAYWIIRELLGPDTISHQQWRDAVIAHTKVRFNQK